MTERKEGRTECKDDKERSKEGRRRETINKGPNCVGIRSSHCAMGTNE